MNDTELAAAKDQLRRKRWNWFGVALIGIVLCVAAGAGQAHAALLAVGFGLILLAAAMYPNKRKYIPRQD